MLRGGAAWTKPTRRSVHGLELFGEEERITFKWNHTYGALDWQQEGTEVFVATTERPLYWKT